MVHGALVPQGRRAGGLVAGGCATVLLMALGLAGCGGGVAETGATPMASTSADLDTARPPPRTVSQTPLLPPMPAQADVSPGIPPAMMNIEHLYSEDEQARIESDLTAAARGQR